MRFRVLGPVGMLDPEDRARTIGSPNQRKVLATLLARRNQLVSTDLLVEVLWGDEAPATAVATMRTYVSRLRRDVGDGLRSSAGGYVLDVGPDDVDADRFEDLVRRARELPSPESADLLQSALDLWSGPAFGVDADLEAICAEAVHLEQRRDAVRALHAATLLDAGRADEAVVAAESILAAEPLRESVWEVLIRALGAIGRSADALRAFQRAAGHLADAGLEPSDSLRAAERDVLVARDTEVVRSSPPVPGGPTDGAATAADAPALELPRRTSSLVGRGAELARLLELVERDRLVSLVGPGGVGKTRLAMELARARHDHHRRGAVWVDLEPLRDRDEIGEAIVAALQVTGGRDTAEALWFAAQLDALVVLDNAEQVLDEVCQVVRQLVADGESVTVLVTSRERLGADGEHVFDVAPLGVGGTGSPSFALLVERAEAAGATIADAQTDDAVELLRRLDGLPLAIEMAAGQLRTRSMTELIELLGRDDLRGPARGAPERHRSLAAVLDWSERSLSDDERLVLHEMSVFAGPVVGPDVAGVSSVDGADDVTRRLVERSLVAADTGGPATTFRLLQTVRAHARRALERSGGVEATTTAHARWFVDVAVRADRGLCGPDEARTYARLASILEELHLAHEWCCAHDHDGVALLDRHLLRFARSGVHDEPLAWAEQCLDLHGEDAASWATLASVAARAVTKSELPRAARLSQLAIERAVDDEAMGAIEVLADVHLFDGKLDEAVSCYLRLAELADLADDDLMRVAGLVGAALAHIYGGEPDRGRALVAGIGDRPDRAPTARGWLEYAHGELGADTDPQVALEHFDRCVALARAARNRYLEGTALISATSLRSRVGDPFEALAQFRTVIRLWNDCGEQTHQLTTLRNLAVLLPRLGMPEVASELLGSVDAAGTTYGDESRRLDEVREWVTSELGAARAEELAAVGARRSSFAAAEWVLDAVTSDPAR
jgi:predicted ATPase/DNA-binding SARP family transcriptional activator